MDDGEEYDSRPVSFSSSLAAAYRVWAGTSHFAAASSSSVASSSSDATIPAPRAAKPRQGAFVEHASTHAISTLYPHSDLGVLVDPLADYLVDGLRAVSDALYAGLVSMHGTVHLLAEDVLDLASLAENTFSLQSSSRRDVWHQDAVTLANRLTTCIAATIYRQAGYIVHLVEMDYNPSPLFSTLKVARAYFSAIQRISFMDKFLHRSRLRTLQENAWHALHAASRTEDAQYERGAEQMLALVRTYFLDAGQRAPHAPRALDDGALAQQRFRHRLQANADLILAATPAGAQLVRWLETSAFTVDPAAAPRGSIARIVELLRTAMDTPALEEVFVELRGAEACAFLIILQDVLDRRQLYAPLLAGPTGPRTASALDARCRAAQRLLARLARASGELPHQLFARTVVLDGLRPRFERADGAEVYKGTRAGLAVALKCVRVPVARAGRESEAFYQTFCAHALAWRQLRHRNVLPFLGIDPVTFADESLGAGSSGTICIVTPWIERGPLLTNLRTRNADPGKYVIEIAQGLAYLHSQGIVHGNLRASNVLIDDEEHAVLTDYGFTSVGEEFVSIHPVRSPMSPIAPHDIAAFVAAANADDAHARLQQQWLGTAHARWAAPELLDPAQFGLHAPRHTPASDAWAFACTAVEVHTQRVPLAHVRDDAAVRARVLAGERPALPAGAAASRFAQALQRELEACWSVRPEGRPSMEDVAVRLLAAVQSSPGVVLGASERSERRRSWLSRRHR